MTMLEVERSIEARFDLNNLELSTAPDFRLKRDDGAPHTNLLPAVDGR